MADEPATGEEGWQVYLLRCDDGTLYTGVTSDIERRLRQHNGEIGGGARYTRARRPVALLWSEACSSRAEAQQREARIKAMPRAAKLRLSRSGLPALPDD